ncbi:MAG TPA: YdeI/OmpD-associated family protein [Tepidisphaeraceae bacterium]|jgi:uncharacterized protein YdeI (YjbR/CyaY-like superfamily)|nr:YdeI/OmpD-associated family protein [Tepidisphaeraceae bacterium]
MVVPSLHVQGHVLQHGQQREYIDWIAQAKREETIANRLETMLLWLAEGKSRNWKYEK